MSARLQICGSPFSRSACSAWRSSSLDALTYPTGNIPAPKLGAPNEPTVNGRPSNAWSLARPAGIPDDHGARGFHDAGLRPRFRIRPLRRQPASARPDGGSAAPTKLVGPVPARLPVGIDFLARPFGEPLLLRIAAAYEETTHHREIPAGFGALP